MVHASKEENFAGAKKTKELHQSALSLTHSLTHSPSRLCNVSYQQQCISNRTLSGIFYIFMCEHCQNQLATL